MNKSIQEQEKIIESIKEKLESAQRDLDELKENKGVRIPEYGDSYWHIHEGGGVYSDEWWAVKEDYNMLYNYNIFKTEEEAQRYADIDFKYKKLIFEANQKEPIDWENENQRKYYLYYSYDNNSIDVYWSWRSRQSGTNYYADREMTHKIIQSIGKEDLEWYLKRS